MRIAVDENALRFQILVKGSAAGHSSTAFHESMWDDHRDRFRRRISSDAAAIDG